MTADCRAIQNTGKKMGGLQHDRQYESNDRQYESTTSSHEGWRAQLSLAMPAELIVAGLQHWNRTVRGKCHNRKVSQLVYKATLFPSDVRDVLQVSVPKESEVFLCQYVPTLRFSCLGKHCNW